MCQYHPQPDPARLVVLMGASSAWYEKERISRFLEMKGYAEAAACLAVDYAAWRREEFERKEAGK